MLQSPFIIIFERSKRRSAMGETSVQNILVTDEKKYIKKKKKTFILYKYEIRTLETSATCGNNYGAHEWK